MSTCPVCKGTVFENHFCKKCGLPEPEKVQKRSASEIRGVPGGQRFKPSLKKPGTVEQEAPPPPEEKRVQKAKPVPQVDTSSLTHRAKTEPAASVGRIQLARKEREASPNEVRVSAVTPKTEEEPPPLPIDALVPLEPVAPEPASSPPSPPASPGGFVLSRCPSCGADLPAGHGKFCDACGLKLPSLSPRR